MLTERSLSLTTAESLSRAFPCPAQVEENPFASVVASMRDDTVVEVEVPMPPARRPILYTMHTPAPSTVGERPWTPAQQTAEAWRQHDNSSSYGEDWGVPRERMPEPAAQQPSEPSVRQTSEPAVQQCGCEAIFPFAWISLGQQAL